MPCPVSAMLISTPLRPSARARWVAISMCPPRSVASRAFRMMFSSTLWNWLRSTVRRGMSGPASKQNSTPLHQRLVGHQRDGDVDQVIEVGALGLQLALAGKIQQALHDFAHPLRGRGDGLEVLAACLVDVRPLEQHVGEGEHAGQRVVDLVRHPGGQAPHRSLFLGLQELQLAFGLLVPVAVPQGGEHFLERALQHPELAAGVGDPPRGSNPPWRRGG